MKTDKTEHNLSICAPSIIELRRVTQARPKWKQDRYRLENITLAVLHGDRTQPSEAVRPSKVKSWDQSTVFYTSKPHRSLTCLQACRFNLDLIQIKTQCSSWAHMESTSQMEPGAISIFSHNKSVREVSAWWTMVKEGGPQCLLSNVWFIVSQKFHENI